MISIWKIIILDLNVYLKYVSLGSQYPSNWYYYTQGIAVISYLILRQIGTMHRYVFKITSSLSYVDRHWTYSSVRYIMVHQIRLIENNHISLYLPYNWD
jgi:hypothetical protein